METFPRATVVSTLRVARYHRLLLFGGGGRGGANQASKKCHFTIGRDVRVLEREVFVVEIRSLQRCAKKEERYRRPGCSLPAATRLYV